MKLTKNVSLTEGPILKNLLLFSLPYVLSNFLQTVYSMTDMVVVGKFCGSASLSGLNIGTNIMFIVMSLTLGFAMGGSVLTSQCYGARDKAGVQKSIGTLFSFCSILAVVITIVLAFTHSSLLEIMNTPPEAMSEGKNYLLICSFGTIFIFGYNAVCAIIRSLGDSTRPMVFVAISASINIALDLLFVAVFDMKAAGAALATVIAQAISFIIAIIYLSRKKDFIFEFKLKSFKIDTTTLKLLLKLGVPTALQHSLITATILVIVSLVNKYGLTVSAGYSVGHKVETLIQLVNNSISSAMTVAIAQNIGAGNVERVKKIVHRGLLVNLVGISAVFLIIQLFASQLSGLFSSESDVIAEAIRYIRIVPIVYFPLAFLFSYQSVITGVGFTTFTLALSLLDGIVMRLSVALILCYVLQIGLLGLYIGMVSAPVLPAIIAMWYFYSGKWEKRSLTRKSAIQEN